MHACGYHGREMLCDSELERSCAEWLGEVDRVGDLKFKGPMQEIVAKQWTEFICEVPAEREVFCAFTYRDLFVATWNVPVRMPSVLQIGVLYLSSRAAFRM